jgi:hypothetical protein
LDTILMLAGGLLRFLALYFGLCLPVLFFCFLTLVGRDFF